MGLGVGAVPTPAVPTVPVPLPPWVSLFNVRTCSSSPPGLLFCCHEHNLSCVAGTVTDFVTPLKKRRLARESISQEYPYPPTPSTPLPHSSGLPSEPLDASPVASDGERPASDCEKSVSDFEKGQPDLDDSRQWKNGLRPTLAPMTPITPNDNLFEVRPTVPLTRGL